MYIQTNNSPARCIEDVKRLSKTAKALIEYVSTISEDGEDEVIENPRYAAFKRLTESNQTTFAWLLSIR